jgi:MGT family glycosyltransferase
MTKYIFCNDPHAGHVHPTLPVVRELVAQGADVIYYCTERFRVAIEAAGASFHPYTSPDMVSPQERKRDFSDNSLINNTHFVLQQVLDDAKAERADVLVYEAMCLWGKILARALRLPAVSLHTTLATNKYFHPFDTYTKTVEPRTFFLNMGEAIKRICTTYGIPLFDFETFFFHDELLNIVFFPREFHPVVETFSKRFLFVGPAIVPRQEESNFPLEQLRKRRVIYVSLGTVENNFPAFFDVCLHAFGQQDRALVLSIGEKIDPQIFGQLPENALLYPYVPQLDILPYTDVFLNHGGSNSIMESLYYGVPVIMLPISLEQRCFASRTQALKLGMMIENVKLLTAHTLRMMAAKLNDDAEICSSVRRMREIIHNAGSYKQAADAMLRLS